MKGFLRIARRVTATLACLAMLLALLNPLTPASAETLADIDAEIRSDRTLTRVAGQDAYNVYAGVTNARLDRKIAILTAAGITHFASAGSYSNFYSFYKSGRSYRYHDRYCHNHLSHAAVPARQHRQAGGADLSWQLVERKLPGHWGHPRHASCPGCLGQ